MEMLFALDSSLILSIVLFIVFLFLILLLEWRRNRHEKMNETKPVSVDKLIEKYGDPDDVIVVNTLLGNRSDGVVLVYNDRESLIINGQEIKKSMITDVSFTNYAVPYLPEDYIIQIYTKLPGKDLIKIPTGNVSSAVYAKEVVNYIRNVLS